MHVINHKKKSEKLIESKGVQGGLVDVMHVIRDAFLFYSYKKFTTIFTFYYTYLATIQCYRDDAKGSEGQRLPRSLNIKTRNYTLHTSNCTPHTVKGQRILYLILFHIGCQIGVGKKFKKVTIADCLWDQVG